MTSDLFETINGLKRDQVIEAARFLGRSVVGEARVDERDLALKDIVAQPYRHLPDIESLARLLLISVASTEEGREDVRIAIAGVGKKQLILGGAEIVALAALGVIALKIVITGGHGRTIRRITLLDVEGQPYAKIETVEEPVSITSELAAVLKGTLGLGGDKDD